jgi:hypothetical protein
MQIEPSSPYTGPQNGAAERSGGVIKDKSCAMSKEGARLPAKLWPEISRAAVYLHNRTPRYMYNWKTPYDRFHTYLAFRDGVVFDHRKPQAAHLHIMGWLWRRQKGGDAEWRSEDIPQPGDWGRALQYIFWGSVCAG